MEPLSEEQNILELMIKNYSNSKFDVVINELSNSTKGKKILLEFQMCEDRLNYYLSLTSIYHTVLNMSLLFTSLSILDHEGGVRSPLSNPNAVSRMKLEPFVGLLIIQFQKLAETHKRFQGVKDEKTKLTKEEKNVPIVQLIKRIKKIHEFKRLRDGSFAHPYDGERGLKVYKNQIITDDVMRAITTFCEPDFEEIQKRLVQLANIEAFTAITFFNKEKELESNSAQSKQQYLNDIIKNKRTEFRKFELNINKPISSWNFSTLFHGFVSYYFCSAELVIEGGELNYKATSRKSVFIKSLYEYSEFVRKKYLMNTVIHLNNVDDSFDSLYKQVLEIKD